MDSAFIHQAANELVQNAGTRNIKQIARSCSLDISETSRIKDMLGLLSLYFDKPLILINRGGVSARTVCELSGRGSDECGRVPQRDPAREPAIPAGHALQADACRTHEAV